MSEIKVNEISKINLEVIKSALKIASENSVEKLVEAADLKNAYQTLELALQLAKYKAELKKIECLPTSGTLSFEPF